MTIRLRIRAGRTTEFLRVVKVVSRKNNGILEGSESSSAKIGRLKATRAKRANPFKYMPPCLSNRGWKKDINLSENCPKCCHCGSLARPAMLMFGDFGFKYDMSQNKCWVLWLAALMNLVEKKSSKDGVRLKVCALEIGCGINVPTYRNLSEMIVEKVVS